MRTRRLLALVLVVAAASAGLATSRSAELSGLPKVIPNVLFSIGKDEARRMGLDEDSIQSLLELRLRQAGVRTTQADEVAKLPDEVRWYVPQLTLDVRVYRVGSESRFYAWGVRAYLYDDVRLTRNSRIRLLAQTWSSRGVYGTVSAEPADARETVRTEINAAIREQLDEFAKAYLAANSGR
jgi:hypothetical protein